MGNYQGCCNFKSYFKSSDIAIDYPDELVTKIKSIVKIQNIWRKHKAILKARKMTIDSKPSKAKNTLQFHLELDKSNSKFDSIRESKSNFLNQSIKSNKPEQKSIVEINESFPKNNFGGTFNKYLNDLSFIQFKPESTQNITDANDIYKGGDNVLMTFYSDQEQRTDDNYNLLFAKSNPSL